MTINDKPLDALRKSMATARDAKQRLTAEQKMQIRKRLTKTASMVCGRKLEACVGERRVQAVYFVKDASGALRRECLATQIVGPFGNTTTAVNDM
jgi:hypothetical protein